MKSVNIKLAKLDKLRFDDGNEAKEMVSVLEKILRNMKLKQALKHRSNSHSYLFF